MVNEKKDSPKQNKQTKLTKEYTGIVVSDKMQKTVVVKVDRAYFHPVVKKVVRRSKSYKVHDEDEKAHTGDVVRITEGRPQSKDKYMYLAEIIKTAQ